MAIENGSSPYHLIIVECCSLNNFEVSGVENNKNKGIL